MLRLSEVTKSYMQAIEPVQVLKGIDLYIERGEYVSIMGPSGSGKSTLMNIIGCLDLPTSGTYQLNGVDIAGISENELSDIRNKHIGFVFQNFNLMPRLTALQNVELPLIYGKIKKDQRHLRAEKYLEKMGLADQKDMYPAQLSGGQKQRVAIARALVTEGDFILADEPTGALDSENSRKIMELFTELNQQGKTIIVITHEQEVAEYTHKKIVLRDGGIQ
ncbi:hypothetical protein IGI37_000742 [Enterococcus sp. AZ194]|uniref:ABC transporter ATP-binding protein n=1 Tax=Enterococcus sp. AZ194 TaxID=2774629 RepID=UPI003F22CA1D